MNVTNFSVTGLLQYKPVLRAQAFQWRKYEKI